MFVCFGGTSGSFGLSMDISARPSLAKIRTIAQTNYPDMPSKLTTVRFRIKTSIMIYSGNKVIIGLSYFGTGKSVAFFPPKTVNYCRTHVEQTFSNQCTCSRFCSRFVFVFFPCQTSQRGQRPGSTMYSRRVKRTTFRFRNQNVDSIQIHQVGQEM